jgi:hypothetical protein
MSLRLYICTSVHPPPPAAAAALIKRSGNVLVKQKRGKTRKKGVNQKGGLEVFKGHLFVFRSRMNQR